MSAAFFCSLLTISSVNLALHSAAGLDANGHIASEVTIAARSAEALPSGWMTSFDTAERLAAKHQKPLLLHFEATWCGACRQMEASVLNRQDVTSRLGKDIIGVRIDADQRRDLIKKYGISTLPTEVVLSPDGDRGSTYVGATSLSSYTSRLDRISQRYAKTVEVAARKPAFEPKAKNVRSCLIERFDGQIVGMGGYSPVALTERKTWDKGSSDFTVLHEGVTYFLKSEKEQTEFEANPERFVPRVHGCDVVALFRQNKAEAGAIEYGSFYQGQLYFFSSQENRVRFEDNPKWYASLTPNDSTTGNFPFLPDNAR